MEDSELNKEAKLHILKMAENHLREEKYIHGYSHGVCSAIFHVINNYTRYYLKSCSDIKLLIPEFTRENALSICRLYKINEPEDDTFWWNRHDFNTRILFVNKLIIEISKKD